MDFWQNVNAVLPDIKGLVFKFCNVWHKVKYNNNKAVITSFEA